jgi:hypothetical protein
VVRAITFAIEKLKSDGAYDSDEIDAGVAQLCSELGIPWKGRPSDREAVRFGHLAACSVPEMLDLQLAP